MVRGSTLDPGGEARGLIGTREPQPVPRHSFFSGDSESARVAAGRFQFGGVHALLYGVVL